MDYLRIMHKEAQEYWRNALADGPCTPFPVLPAAIEDVVVDNKLEHQILLHGTKSHDITPPNLIRAAWALVASRAAYSNDVVFGIAVSGSDQPDGAVSTGDAVASRYDDSMVPVRVRVTSDQAVLKYLQGIQQQAQEMVPFESVGLRQIANQCPDNQQACAFQALLDIQTQQGDETAQKQQQNRGINKHALRLTLRLGSDSIMASASFDSRLVSSQTMQNLMQQFDTVLTQLYVATPTQKLMDIQMVTKEDLERIWGWNGTIPASMDRCIHDMVQERARIQPNKIAISAWDGELTYGELDRLSTNLAYRLIIDIGIRPETLVPLCFEKSVWTTVVILAVLKAGGAFVMLDSKLPEQRLKSIIQQVKATLVLSSASNWALSSKLTQRVITMDSDFFRDLHNQHEGEPLPLTDHSSTMYVVFTSGSTGTPKGVVVAHGNLASAISHQISLLKFTTEPRFFDFASYSYDVSISNAFFALITGGCLCVPSDQDRQSNISGSMASLGANVAVLTPSVARVLEPHMIPNLEMLILVGETVSVADVKRWWNKVRLIHRYGVSECPAASILNCDARSAEEATRIGKGAGLVTWVVDQDNHDSLLPVGHIGELLLEGPHVSRGYLGDAEKTAAKFIYNPPWLLQGPAGRQGRLYKTGDLVRYNQDGSLTFIGRKDTQVKIRGQRAELGEIEYRVQESIPGARQVVADLIVPQGEEDASPVLAAFVTFHQPLTDVSTGRTIDDPESVDDSATVWTLSPSIQTKLAEKLPSYMVPTVFFTIRTIPMTPTGKADRRRLCHMGGSFTKQQLAELKTAGHGLKRQPVSQLQREIQRILSTILHLEQGIIGLDDSFLQLGGDSIAAMKVVAEARKDGFNLTVANLFRSLTLEELATTAQDAIQSSPEIIPPFSLLRGDGAIDIGSLLEDISAQFQIDCATIQDVYPCTALQEGLVSLSSTKPGDYINHTVMELFPGVEVETFCKAWEEVIRATAILRTRIVHHSEVGLVQVVLDKEIRWIETTGLVDEYIKADMKQPMEMGQSLVRFALVHEKMGTKKWFVCTMHHALYDGWSMPLVIDAVHRVYQGNTLESSPPFKVFIKYITEQNKSEAASDYWLQTLADCDSAPFPVLPAWVQRPTADTLRRYPLGQLAVRPNVNITTSNLIRAAWALVVGRVTNTNDVVFGATVSGRNAPVFGVDKMMAPTIATIPVSVKMPRDQSVSEYLKAVQRQATEMIPFEQFGLQKMAKLCPGCQHACSFQTLLVVQPEHPEHQKSTYTTGGLGRWHDASQQQQQRNDTYALTLEVQLGLHGDVVVEASFDSRVIGPSTVERLLEQLNSTMGQLNGAATGREQRLTEIQMVTDVELERVWEQNGLVPAPVERCVHDMIEELAVAQPDAPAVCAWDGELTYRELDRLATRLACRLVHYGIGADVIVPLCLEKSMWMPVAMLGVLKAGGAFVMLDPSLPEQRLQTIVQEVGAGIIVSSSLNESLSLRLVSEVVIVGPESDTLMNSELTKHWQLHSPMPAHPSSLMYIVFTSGSTGTPKGSMLTHTNVASALHYQIELLGMTPKSRLYDFASYSFDVSVNNAFSALVAGGCLCIPNDADRKNNLAASIRALRANFVEFTPSVAQLLSPYDVPGLETVVLGGEAVNPRDAERWWGKCRVINTYGPSECTATSTVNHNASSPREASQLGVGAGLLTWVVDPENHNNLLPLGSIGELVLEGPLVGRGYLNNPEKTATAFIQDPAWLICGSPGHSGRHGRLYKTGDLVRCEEDGSLIFLGRKDSQVKIRGQRVELGEVEQRVQGCVPDARQVVAEVIMPQGEHAKPTLVAFLQMDQCVGGIDIVLEADVGTEGVRVFPVSTQVEDKLAEHLPSYMVPNIFFSMQRLPVTPTGKTNRKRLREMGGLFSVQQLVKMQTTQAQTKQQPMSKLERQMQSVYAKVLNIDPSTIGVDDSFFRLGGDSITAMQASAAARALSLNISTLDIMQKKKISRLVRDLAFEGPKQRNSMAVSHEGRVVGDFSRQLSPIQRLYFSLQPDPTKAYDQRFLLKLRAKIEYKSLLTALKTLVSRHNALRARFTQSEEGTWEQSISNDTSTSLSLRIHQRAAGTDGETAQVIARCRESLDIESGPLVAALLFDDETGEEPQSLFLSVHHLVIDLVSWRVLFRELEELLTSGSITAPTSTPFDTWIDLQAQYVSENLAGVAQAAAVHALPFTYWGMEHNANLQSGAIAQHFSVDKDTSSMLLNSCNDAFGTRPVELMLSALIYSFGLTFPDRALPTVFMEGHGREPWDSTMDISSTVGWFTTIYPVQVGINEKEDELSLSNVIRRTKDHIRSLDKNGWSQFTSQFAGEADANKFASQFPVEITFNYEGQYQQLEREDALFEELDLPFGCEPASSSELRRWSLFDIDLRVEKGCMAGQVAYHKDMGHQTKILDWITRYKVVMTQMAKELTDSSHYWTLSDFPLAFQSYHDVEEFQKVWVDRLAIEPKEVEDIFPCSPIQEGILLAQAKDDRNYRSYIEFEIRVSGRDGNELDLIRLQQAWRAVVRRHELLRCIIMDSIPGIDHAMQVVLRDPVPRITFFPKDSTDDMNGIDKDTTSYQKYELQHHLTIRQLDKTTAYVRLEMDHSIADGFSNTILVDDLRAAYHDEDSLRPAGSYRDFIAYLEEQPHASGLQFWTKHLADVDPCFLPVVPANDNTDSSSHSIGPVQVPDIQTMKLRKFCAASDVTAATVIQAAWAIVLRRYVGTNTPCFGNLRSGRDVPVNRSDRILGPLIGMVPCRVDLNKSQTVLETLQTMQNDYVDSVPHQHFPLAAIHRALGLGASALFNTALSFQKVVEGGDEVDDKIGDGLMIRTLRDEDPTEYDVSISAVERRKSIKVQLDLRPGTVTVIEAARLARCLSTAISQVIASPSKRIEELSLVGDVDLEQIWEWNCAVPAPLEKCVHTIIEEMARAQPSAPAVCAWDGELTYGELDDLATRLARRLIDNHGVKHGSLVPLCFEKSMWTTVAILGVLKTGSAFVLLDPSLSSQRLQTIMQQIKADLVLSSHSCRKLSSQLAREVIVIGADFFQDLGDECVWDLPTGSPSSMIYVVFTSGSTGTPKGVTITHQNLASALHYQVKLLGFQSTPPRIFDFASYSFDAAVFNTFITLAAGGCLCVPSDQGRKNNLQKSVKVLRADMMVLTPSTAQLLSSDDLPEIQCLMFCGEAVRLSDVQPWWGKVRILNGYGPSECTPMSTFNYYASSPEEATGIGKGAGMVTWVVDPDNTNCLLPPGCIGELLLEGPLIGSGYLNDVEKTAAVFIDTPAWLLRGSSTQPGRRGRLYKTGDLVRYKEDGSLTFFGRKDAQVKIRGQRVELGEIEHRIQECLPAAKQIVAEVILPQSNDKPSPVLAAFIQLDTCLSQGSQPGTLDASILPITAELEDRLSELLPSYMVPRVFFSMHQLPITTTGKIDRKKVRDIGGSFSVQQLADIRTAGAASKRRPETHAEREIQRIWADVLNINSTTIGLDDSFFRLGGDSIAAMKVVAEACKAGLGLAVSDIFSYPKLQDVAQKSVQIRDDALEEIAPFSLLDNNVKIASMVQDIATQCQVEATTIEDAYPCTPLQEGLLSLSLKRPGDYVLQGTLELSPGVATNIDTFRNAWQHVASSMPILRTRITQHDNNGFLQAVLDEDIKWIEATGLESYVQADKAQAMGLGQPLIRYALIRDDNGSHRWFVWTVHHALYDGWLLSLILDAVDRAYRGNYIPRESHGFKSFVKYIQEQDDEQRTAYWRKALAGCKCTPFPALPSGLQEPVADGLVVRQLPLKSRSDVTPSTMIRAAWGMVASRMTSSDDVVFGATVSGRNAPVAGIDQMPGPTIATVPVRIKSTRSQTITDYLESVQKQAADMIPFEQSGLHRIAQTGADSSQQACQFQTLLVIQPRADNDESSHALGTWKSSSEEQFLNSYPLMLELQLDEASVTVTVNFDSRVIESWMVSKLLDMLDSTMQQLGSAEPNQLLSSVEMVTSQDVDTIWKWNSTVPSPVEKCVHTIIEERVQADPNAPAVCGWDGELTYRELDSLATGLARRLIDHVSPGALIPLCFEKSIWTTVAILGVLKAGGAFVLLDTSVPEQRLQNIIQQVKATVILCSQSNKAQAARLVPAVIPISLDTLGGDLDNTSSRHLPDVKPSDPMYSVFTSGSTGTPKGVVITHQNLASALQHQVKLFGFRTAPRIFDFASYSFDASIFTAFITLAAGGCLCVPSDQERKDNISASIRALDADVVILTPSVAQFLSPDDVPQVRSLMFCGEAVRLIDVQPWWNKNVRILNGYGPSECTPMSTFNYYSTSPKETTRIGKGAGLVTWVVNPDNHKDLLPIGCVGELLLEGPLLSPGYLDDLQKTAISFIEDPEWLVRGIPNGLVAGRRGRLYKTGDLVQYNEDGSLTFVGRKDAQVKIRGQRVELGEVEHWVRECVPQAMQVVADVIELRDGDGEQAKSMLAVFLQLDTRTTTTEMFPVSPDVEDKLAQHLPRYMVPTVFFAMDQIPMTATGKTDRMRMRDTARSFSVQQLAEMETRVTKRKPTSHVELQLQRIWAHVLHIDPETIGLDVSFFRLGGDSISAMKVVGEARRVSIQLAVADIFSDPRLCHVSEKAIHLQDNVPEDIPPFTLLGDHFTNSIASIRDDVASQCQVDAANIEDIYPCTPLQEGLLSLSLKRPGDYIMRRILELSPDVNNVNLGAFRNAWEEVARSTAILRTRITQHKDFGLLQVVLKEDIQWIEATGLTDYLEADKNQPMGTGQPLIRYALIKGDAGKRWFVWTIHHALYDGWSLTMVESAVSKTYYDNNSTSNCKPPQTQFKSFVKHILQQNTSDEVDYWRAAMEACNSTPFPFLPPSVQQPLANQLIEYELVTSSPINRGESLDITPANLLRAAWALVTARSMNVEEVVFGVTVSGRSAAVTGIEDIVGPTIATVPVRVRFAAEQKVSAYLEAVQKQALDMMPFEHTGLQRISKMSTDCQQACMFQTLLVIQPPSHGNDKLAVQQQMFDYWEDGNQQQSFNTYALTLEIQLGLDDKMMRAKASFDSKVIDSHMVQGLLRRLEHVTQQLRGADLEQTLSDIDVMTEQDLETIWDWNRTVPVSIDKTVHSIVEGWAEKQPTAPAICAWDGGLTYGELDKYATNLARRLVNAGVRAGTLLPLCFEKSRWTSVAILATLKAGAAFVLLDPALPEKRLQTIVRQVQASLILTSPSNQTLSSRLAKAVMTVNADMLGESSESQIMTPVLPETGPAFDIYVVFTSGSTGTPKGVMVQHRNLSSALCHQARDHGVTAASRVFDFASYSFDASIINIFMALAAGACLCVPSDEDRKNDLAGCISSLRATIAHLTPSVAQFLVPEEVPELQTIILAGEAVRVRDVERWWGKVNVFNIYGPSECTPFSTINQCTTTLEAATGIGKGSGQVTWVVDPENHDRLVAIGCIGELLLEGPLVGSGYVGDLDKTAAAFIQDPAYLLHGMPSRHQAGRQGRLYKTGDLVRYNGDGSLVFVGRKDDQVKIRGQRVELGEVENCIQQHMKQVKQVVAEVIIPRGQDARPTLAAFVHVGDEADDSTGSEATILAVGGDVERTLATYLPHYMVPTVFFLMRELPMTATGKTNRKRLREIGESLTVEELAEMRRTAVQGFETKTKPPPASSLEQLLQGIWSLVLGIESAFIGRDDNFFQLGGDSIGTMQMVGAARKVGVSLSVAQIFRHPTLRSLAESLNNTPTVNQPGSDDEGGDYDESPLVDPDVMEDLLSEINSSHLHLQSEAPLEILPITQFQHDKVARGFNDPRQFCNYFYLDLGHDVDLADLERNCSVTLQRHPILRAYFLPLREQFWQVIPKYQPDHIPFNIQDVDQDLDKAFLDFCMKDIEQVSPTDLAIQFLLLRHEGQGSRFVLRLSHAQYDGISLPTIVRSLLGSRSEDWALTTPPDFSDFLAYAHRQRHKSRAYWKQLLQGSSITRSAPLLSTKQKAGQDVEAIEIEAEIPLPRLPSNITLASLLSSAWAVILSRITGKDDVVYGRLVAGRNAAIEGVEDIVGPCANIVPVRVNMSLPQTPADLLAYVQEQFIALGEADSLGLRDISENCTNWPVDSAFDSIIQHQNVDEHPEFQVAGVINSMNGFRNPHNIDRSLYMMSHPQSDRLRIELFANSHIMAAETAHVLLDALCAAVQKLASCPDMPLQLCLEEIVVDFR